ncbi:HEPN domain-containing protein [[Limnothrix rosea] IAM M-220]|uniref:HEPN domain-containing protein n=1 Tax=[Limnothrix rosea] IAM M-220 TaxID=454133 RepID=UPI00095F6366|nr:HEPN domain-containing protein [[Limnothrix rosea] IAM M-220]OKH18767.1 HEPN domain-containing protein [[Limnothrix rosea] IAM M-220]
MSKEIIQYRLDRAEETYQAAQFLATIKNWNSCINRLYYSCFYAVSALLLKDSLSSPKHTGVRSLFNKNYVKTGIISKDLARLYNDLFERRHEADYADFVDFDESETIPLLHKTRVFLNEVSKTIATNPRKS